MRVLTLSFSRFWLTCFTPGVWLQALNLGPLCSAATTALQQVDAAGLLYCTDGQLGTWVAQCQVQGRKVLLSLRGLERQECSQTIRNPFLGGMGNAATGEIGRLNILLTPLLFPRIIPL
jgi:hypothetical protein